jgi:hypothetical protein
MKQRLLEMLWFLFKGHGEAQRHIWVLMQIAREDPSADPVPPPVPPVDPGPPAKPAPRP